jgi:acetyl esterase/lipase
VTALAAAAVLAACGGGEGAPSSSETEHFAGTHEVRAGVEADVYRPDRQGPAPVVVLVPGGGWSEADRTGLAPLAERLARSGAFVVNTSYRAQSAGGVFPTPAEDVACAVGLAAVRAADAGRDGGPLVLVGHSAGAHLGALVALAPDRFRAPCPYPPASVDALVGLSGPYDPTRLPDVAQALFGQTLQEAPGQWRAGNPLTWAAARPEVRILLLHGTGDSLVPTSFTKQFAQALRSGGHQVAVDLLRGADHDTYRAAAAGKVVTSWITALATADPSQPSP